MSDIERYYDPEKNPQQGTFPFQPLSDITTEQWADLTKEQQASVDAAGFWRKTKPRPVKDEAEFKAVKPITVPESEAS